MNSYELFPKHLNKLSNPHRNPSNPHRNPSNLLARRPDVFSACKNLQSLTASHNRLVNVRTAVSRLYSLQQLNLCHNRIRVYPRFQDLPLLSEVDLSHNLFESVRWRGVIWQTYPRAEWSGKLIPAQSDLANLWCTVMHSDAHPN